MSYSTNRILEHHRNLHGILRHQTFKSQVLGIRKPYYLYQSPNWHPNEPFLLIWLFRGHEREWVNFREDPSRKETTAIQDLDALVLRKIIPPCIAIMPGLASANNWVPSGGVNMTGHWKSGMKGLGTGRFWDYLSGELIPYIEEKYNHKGKAQRLAFGFSLGGYTVQLLSMAMPGYLHDAAIYDGLFPWPGHIDPRQTDESAHKDKVWDTSGIFDGAFGTSGQRQALDEWNPTDMLLNADPDKLSLIQKTRFWISSAAGDGRIGNIDRSRFLVAELEKNGIPNQFKRIPLADQAAHDWHWNDVFFNKVLVRATGEL